MMTKKILDVTCGSRSIWFNKKHPAAIYCDVRDEEFTGIWKSTNRDSKRTCIVHPDVLCDFTDLPFPSNSFALVVFDPPHLRRISENAWMRKKYGQLGENWREMPHDPGAESKTWKGEGKWLSGEYMNMTRLNVPAVECGCLLQNTGVGRASMQEKSRIIAHTAAKR